MTGLDGTLSIAQVPIPVLNKFLRQTFIIRVRDRVSALEFYIKYQYWLAR